MIDGNDLAGERQRRPIAMNARDAECIQLTQVSRVSFVDTRASVQPDESEKEADAHRERYGGSDRLRRQRKKPRGRQNGEDERSESRHPQPLAATMRAPRCRVELGGALLVPGSDFAVVAGDQDLSSFSD